MQCEIKSVYLLSTHVPAHLPQGLAVILTQDINICLQLLYVTIVNTPTVPFIMTGK